MTPDEALSDLGKYERKIRELLLRHLAVYDRAVEAEGLSESLQSVASAPDFGVEIEAVASPADWKRRLSRTCLAGMKTDFELYVMLIHRIAVSATLAPLGEDASAVGRFLLKGSDANSVTWKTAKAHLKSLKVWVSGGEAPGQGAWVQFKMAQATRNVIVHGWARVDQKLADKAKASGWSSCLKPGVPVEICKDDLKSVLRELLVLTDAFAVNLRARLERSRLREPFLPPLGQD